MSFQSLAQSDILFEDLARQIDETQLAALQVGETTLPVIEQSADAVLPRGVAMLLVDGGHQGLTLNAALQLAGRLNRWGWHTRIVVLHHPDGAPTIEPTAAANRPSPAASQISPWVDYAASQQQTRLLMHALFSHVEGIKGLRVLVTQGMTAAQYLMLSKAGEVPAPDTLVTIAPYWPDKPNNDAISEAMANTQYPVLDLRLADLNQWESQTARPRNIAAKQALKLHYRQRTVLDNGLPLTSLDGFSSPIGTWLGKEIYGWIRYLGW